FKIQGMYLQRLYDLSIIAARMPLSVRSSVIAVGENVVQSNPQSCARRFWARDVNALYCGGIFLRG
ncbi:hypothetical protein, partial [Pectobacterium brasiliense]|uniref:hypothetical protein n=1 Tax=Pectobacterium brasiliense TaxID=180957 RepID=UPI0019697A66